VTLVGVAPGCLVSTAVAVEEGWPMGSLFEELEAREAAARDQVEQFEAELADLTGGWRRFGKFLSGFGSPGRRLPR